MFLNLGVIDMVMKAHSSLSDTSIHKSYSCSHLFSCGYIGGPQLWIGGPQLCTGGPLGHC